MHHPLGVGHPRQLQCPHRLPAVLAGHPHRQCPVGLEGVVPSPLRHGQRRDESVSVCSRDLPAWPQLEAPVSGVAQAAIGKLHHEEAVTLDGHVQGPACRAHRARAQYLPDPTHSHPKAVPVLELGLQQLLELDPTGVEGRGVEVGQVMGDHLDGTLLRRHAGGADAKTGHS